MAGKSAQKVIGINELAIERVPVTIVGTTPLIVHAWSEKARRMMLDKQTKAATKSKHEAKVPTNDFMNSLYWLTEKPKDGETDEEAEAGFDAAVAAGAAFGFPLSGIKQSIISGAARGGLDVKMTELRGTFFLRGGGELSTPELARIVGPAPIKREDMVRVGGMSKTADIRYRGEFATWEIPLVLEYNRNGKYSLEQLLNMVEMGGFVTGIGEWRPERNGQFGMYRLKA